MTMRITAAIATLFTSAHPGLAQDATPGETYARICANCHGPTARGMASFPSLAGQSKEYLTGRLTQYRDGETVGPNSALMIPMVSGLSDEELSGLAAYISTEYP